MLTVQKGIPRWKCLGIWEQAAWKENPKKMEKNIWVKSVCFYNLQKKEVNDESAVVEFKM
jgi:hypothetical protein